ncbi:MAG: NAD(P)/FAD-dependent oxidoreductase [Promethearchaeota archaeon]|nr:MAG: NAD(P)/FAD-dependent oxidoreductase [Candidatus Lokiarchaeota archaeon]
MKEIYDYIIVGGGISGLHLGALLSRHGRVIIFERSDTVGGRAKVIEKDGFKLDYGIHLIRFGPESALGASLLEINKSISFIKPGRSWAFLKNGERKLYPTGSLMDIVRSDLVPFGKTIRLLLKIKKMDQKKLKPLYDTSLADWYQQENILPKIQTYLTMTSSAVQVNPFPNRSSAGELLKNIQRVLEMGSAYYPQGGWGPIFNQFENFILENGGKIELNSAVTEILIENGSCKGVKVRDNIFNGSQIISTIPVQELFTILDEKYCESQFINKCKNLRPTAGVVIDFCLDEQISDIDGLIFFEEPLSFGFIPSNLSKDVAPEGKSLMTFLRVANVEDMKNKDTVKEIYQEFRKVIFRAFPEIESHLIDERSLFLPMVDGVEVNIKQHQFNRLGHTIKNVEKLWLVGDSVGGEGAGGDVGHTSVRECYKQIRRKENT